MWAQIGRMMRLRIVAPGLYLALSTHVWLEFVRTNPDGLANVALFAVTLPIALLGLLIGSVLGTEDFPLLPRGFGYINDHALYYWPSVLLIAAGLYWVGAALGRRISGR